MDSRTSLPPPAADALFRAAREHATGWLTFTSGGAEARLYLQAGDLVGARLGFGYQTLAQALLVSGALDLPAFDALWARGELGASSSGLLQAAGGDVAVATEVQTLASVRRLVSYGGEATFMPAMVEAGEARVSGARAARAAFETLGPLAAGAIVRCREVEECAGWLFNEEERELLSRFSTFRPAGDLSATQAALLRLLQHDGRVEILDAAGFEARAAFEQEEEQRRAEEEARRNMARAAIEQARSAEEARRTEQRLRAEQARRALEAARAAEAAWRDAQAQVPRHNTPVEEALADTVVRGHPAVEPTTLTIPLPLVDSTDPAFPQPGFEDVPRLTAAEAVAAGILEPDTLRPAVVPAYTGRGDTLRSHPPEEDGPAAPARHKTEEPLIIPGAAPGEAPVKRRDTLPTFAALEPTPVLSEARPETERRPAGSTPIWGSDVDASETLLQSAESVEIVPLPGGHAEVQAEPILLFADAELPPEPSRPSALVEEMTEALRRAGASVPAEGWLAATEGVVSAAPAPASPGTPRPPEQPLASEPSRPPLRLGPEAPSAEEDLWRLVQAPAAPAPAAASFEEALANVDAHLSTLVGLSEEPVTRRDVLPVDAILQASAEAGAWQMETLPPVAEPPPAPPAPLEATPALTPSGGSGGGEASRERRQRLLRRAMQNLGSLVSRPPRTMGSATPLEPTPAPIPPSSLPRTPAEQALARQVEERFAGLSGDRNRFEILGLHLEASREQVKAAFLDLVKVFHPDRLPPTLGALVPQATAVFDSLREAQDYLQDDERRAFHAREMAALASGRPLRDQAEAAEAYRAGEVALRRRDHAAAEAHFVEAYRLYPRAHVLAARAWAIYMDPNRKADAASARAMMVDALKEDPNCDRAHYQLGVIARVEGDVERAERHFREALRANPRHLESSQELRLIEMRKRGGPSKKPR
jgi:curved DNA-binding protein CbpA